MSSMSNDSLALRDHPFKITPDRRFFYRGRVMQAVYDSLLEGVFERQGLLLVAGDAGTGKTTLLLKLKEALEATDCLVVFPRSPVLSFDELIDACCQAAGVGAEATSRMNRIRAFTDVLVRQVDQGRATAILIDDAEELNDDFLADLSRLTAIEKSGQRLVQIVLAGHHELVQRLTASDLPFVQECAISYRRLGGLDRHEVTDYIAYRLARVGRDGIVFTPSAIRRIAQISKGVPQVVNQLCGMCLHIAELDNSQTVSLDIVEATAPDFLTDSAVATIAAVETDAPEDGASNVEASEAEATETGALEQETPEVEASAQADSGLEELPPSASPDAVATDAAAQPQLGPVSIDWRTFRNEMRGRVPTPLVAAEETMPPLPSFYRNEVQSMDPAPARRVSLIALMFVVGSFLGGAGAYYLGAWPGQEIEPLAQNLAPLGLPEAAPVGRGDEVVSSSPAPGGQAQDGPAPSGSQVALSTAPNPRLDQPGAATSDPQLRALALDPVLTTAPVPAPAPAPAPAAAPVPEAPVVVAPKAPTQATQPAVPAAPEPPAAPASVAVLPAPEVDLALSPAPKVERQEVEPQQPAAPTAAAPTAAATATAPNLLPRPEGAAVNTLRQADAVPEAADPPELPRRKPKLLIPQALIVARPSEDPTTSGLVPESPTLPLAIVRAEPPKAQVAAPQSPPAAPALRPVILTPVPADGLADDAPGALPGRDPAVAAIPEKAQAPLSLLPPDLLASRTSRAAAPATEVAEEPTLPAPEAPATAALSPESLSLPAKPVAAEQPNNGVIIQFAALRSESDAGRERERLNQRFGSLLKPLDLSIVKANVNGVPYYRVRSGPLAGRGKAYDLCAELRKSDQGCMVIHPDGFVADGADGKLAAAFDAANAQTPDADAPADATAPLDLIDIVVAHDVQDREPVNPTEVFAAATDQAYVHAKVRNPGPRAKVAFVWRYDNALISRFETEIGTSARWRTWSSSALQPGPWKVQLVTAEGQIMGERSFIVE